MRRSPFLRPSIARATTWSTPSARTSWPRSPRSTPSPSAENRVTYGEGVEDVDEALALVGKRRLDVTIAKAFFGDARRLQRDVLGDAVDELLAETDLAPIA